MSSCLSAPWYLPAPEPRSHGIYPKLAALPFVAFPCHSTIPTSPVFLSSCALLGWTILCDNRGSPSLEVVQMGMSAFSLRLYIFRIRKPFAGSKPKTLGQPLSAFLRTDAAAAPQPGSLGCRAGRGVRCALTPLVLDASKGSLLFHSFQGSFFLENHQETW